ncbi:MAG: hypothetical protein ABIK93_08380 [candidate division WOR-3 bacterium]
MKEILGKFGVPTWQNLSYLNFARKLDKFTRRYSDNELKKQIELAMAQGLKLNLDKTILEKIKDCILRQKF